MGNTKKLEDLSLNQIRILCDQYILMCHGILMLNTAAFKATRTGTLEYETNLHDPTDRNAHNEHYRLIGFVAFEDRNNEKAILLALMKHWAWLADRKVLDVPVATAAFGQDQLILWNLKSVHLWSDGMKFPVEM